MESGEWRGCGDWGGELEGRTCVQRHGSIEEIASSPWDQFSSFGSEMTGNYSVVPLSTYVLPHVLHSPQKHDLSIHHGRRTMERVPDIVSRNKDGNEEPIPVNNRYEIVWSFGIVCLWAYQFLSWMLVWFSGGFTLQYNQVKLVSLLLETFKKRSHRGEVEMVHSQEQYSLKYL